ncbi:FAD-dependent oxidoreductase [uncultured Nocardioides sp.]|uniref:FAD-dependent oxidoreductase n=1 Tax=uncultured Nocardioides sp. TaxID=198441 RepID=UPI0026201D74|nr:FAD-dependent oxidoreductase [uncultured Nocardioides sp.]
MAYVVTQPCCADASCVLACPVNCIHPAPGEPGFAEAEMVYIDPRSCVGCGACATACPVDAIKPDTALAPDQQVFAGMNADYYDVFAHPDRTPLAVVGKQRRLRGDRGEREVAVAVVGAGPAGLYAADELLKHPEIGVDVLDRLPTPYGLLRAGVAPDHQHTKQAERLFGQIETQPGFRYLLGAEVGTDLTHDELAARYDAVVYAVGASADRRLGIEGEDLAGSLSATDLVGWYNGHPDHQDLGLDLSHERVVVVGNGNVALDAARILTSAPERLVGTDIARPAYEAIAAGGVREVVVLGRRGPGQAAFTVPELVGLVGLADAGEIDVVVEPGGAELGDSQAERLLADLLARTPTPGRRRIVLRFLTAPVRVLGEGGRVSGLEVVRTRLQTDQDGVSRAVATDDTEVLATGTVLRSVGHQARPVPGLPFDDALGTVPHQRGRVAPGTYVVGWIKRGPTGFLGTNKTDAIETVTSILDDLDAGTAVRRDASADPSDLPRLLRSRGVVTHGRRGWDAIDDEERRRGASEGRPRSKITARAELDDVAARAKRSRRYAGLVRG